MLQPFRGLCNFTIRFRLFRHSFLAQYDIYNIATGERTKLQPDLDVLIKALGGGGPGGPPPPPPEQAPPQPPLELAMWGPKAASVAYVFGANIYYRDTPESQDIMVSTSGRPGVVYNGVADWVYEVSLRISEYVKSLDLCRCLHVKHWLMI